jgi:hypothetical protein
MVSMSLRAFRWIGEIAVGMLRPPLEATSARVRKSGALGIAVGLTLFVSALAVLAMLNQAGVDLEVPQRWILLVVFPGLAFMIVGGYRVIAGREPEHASSFRRVALGVVGGLFAFSLLIAAFVIAILGSEALKR